MKVKRSFQINIPTLIYVCRKSIKDVGWSDLVTPLQTSKDKEASLLIDSGYAGEQPSGGGGGDLSIPFGK